MKKALFLFFNFLLSFPVFAQDYEFWFAAPDVAEDHADAPTFFVFSNPSKLETATVTLDIYGGAPAGTFNQTFTYVIPPGGYRKVDFDAIQTRTWIENPTYLQGTVGNYGTHITSNVKILAYYMVNSTVQRDIYALKGKPALGTHFITPFQEHVGDYFEQRDHLNYNKGADQIDIVASEDNTNVTVILTKSCLKGFGGSTTTISGTQTFTFTNKGQTLTLREDTIGTPNPASSTDIALKKNTGTLAGTTITSDKPIAVTTTEDCISAVRRYNLGSTDLAGDQIVPINMVGKRYVVVRGWSTVGERVDFTATKPNTTINVHYFNSSNSPQMISSPLLNTGGTWHVNMKELGTTNEDNDIFVDATEPVYCYQHSAVGGELGAAIIPSMYSISQQQIDFYQSSGFGNYVFLVFRKDCDTTFTISYDSGIEQPLTVTPIEIPSGIADEWRYAKVTLPATGNDKMATIRNSESTFSLGYFNAASGTASYGYLSGFGDFQFDPDTIWRCQGGYYGTPIAGGYAKSYKWTFPDGSIQTTPSIRAKQPGMYILEMDQDPRILIDTCWVLDMVFDAEINREPRNPKPAKIDVPQQFRAAVKGATLPNLNCHWTFEGGIPATSNSFSPTVVWNSTGEKKVTLHLSATGGSGANQTICDTTIVAYYKVKPKNIGYFVSENGGNDNNEGSSWPEAFSTVQRALDYASQGDYIWVARGNYNPGGDHLTYVVDYDSVQIYGGFRGNETNLNERDIASNPTILNGRDNSVVTFDGSISYTNGTCGTGTDTRLDGFIIQNGKAKNGAGIQFINGASGTIAHCVIRQNVAEQRGGGIYTIAPLCNHNSPILINTEVSGNQAANGAGIYNDGSDLLAINVTVSGNGAGNTGGGLYNAGGNPDIRNTIIFGNKGQNDNTTDVLNSGGTPLYAYSVVGGSNGSGSTWNNALGTDGGKNKDGSPLFKKSGYDQFGNIQEGNYRLTGSSNSVNSGRNAYVLQGIHTPWNVNLLNPQEGKSVEGILTDLDGMNRIAYDIVDRGAYEYDPNADYTAPVHEVNIPVFENLTTDPPASRHWVTGHESFTLVIMPGSGYSLEHMTITSGSAKQDEKMTQIKNADGSVTIIFHQITEALNIRIENVSPTSNLSIDGYAVWSYNNQLHIKATMEGMLKIYTLNGQLYKQQPVVAGETSIALPQGVYVVSLDEGTKQKVVIK